VTNGSCDTCSSASECTAVTCDTNYFNVDSIFNNGCEATCPDVTNGSCDTCSSASECTAVTCDTNYFNVDSIFNNGCEATCPDVTNGSCDTCSSASECTAVTCDTNYFNGDAEFNNGCMLCKANHHVVSNVCTACDGGLTNPAGDDASGSDTLCGCAANEYVKDKVCTPCRAGTKNDAGDDSTAGDTTCTAVECPVNSNGNDVSDGCTCDPGFSGGVTATSTDLFYTSTCTPISCGENEHVKSNACVTCSTGTDNVAGDDASKADTMCDGTPTRSYTDLGWRGSSCINPAASTVGGASRLVIGDKKKRCYAGKTFKQAESICYEAGARLCTYDDIEAGVTTGTGCNYDFEHVWTSTSGDCEAGQHVTLLGKGGGKCNAGKLDSKKRCDADSYVAKGVRCCADTVVSDPPHHISKVTVEIKAGSDTVVMADVTGIKADDQLRITNPISGQKEVRTVLSITTNTARSRSQRSPTSPTPGTVTVDEPFGADFPLGSTIAISTPPTLPPPAFVWETIRGCCRERVENSKRGLNHHGTASAETLFGSLDSVLINCTAACATDAVCTAVEVTKKNRAAAKCEFHVERMNAGDRSTKSCKKATCMVKTGFVAPETAAPPPASHSPTEWNERRGCCREHAGKKKYVNHVGTNIIIAERTYAAATKACKDECDGRSTCTAVETRRNQRKKVYMCELHTASGINASSRASKSCKKALCAVKV